jgi:uncharacterized membrane protein YphA (DoxX/SURF4 family)
MRVNSQNMDPMSLLRAVAAIVTVTGAILVAVNWSPRVTLLGFSVFVVASIAWMIDGWLEDRASLILQNAILLLVNIGGIYRWLPRAAGETEMST